MIRQMKLDVDKFGSINTKNFDATGENCKLRNDDEKKKIEELKKRFEVEKLKREKEEEEKKRLQNEIQKMKDDDRKKQELLNKMKKKEEEDKKKYEKYEPLIREAEEKERKFQEEQKKIEEEAKNRGVEILRINKEIDEKLADAGFKVKTGASISVSAFTLGYLMFEVAGQTTLTNALGYGFLFPFVGGAAFAASALFPLGYAGCLALKKLWT